ncbi:hypothetical protein F2P79_024752 [Pimephales promelas]|nr:hypothetical protein F2P79_024752 [Pimephales promelas]
MDAAVKHHLFESAIVELGTVSLHNASILCQTLRQQPTTAPPCPLLQVQPPRDYYGYKFFFLCPPSDIYWLLENVKGIHGDIGTPVWLRRDSSFALRKRDWPATSGGSQTCLRSLDSLTRLNFHHSLDLQLTASALLIGDMDV